MTFADHHAALDRRIDPAATPRGLRAHWPTLQERIEAGDLKPASELPRPRTAAQFAFATRLDAFTKPYVFADGAALARSIHRRREGRCILVRKVLDLRAGADSGLARVLPRDRTCQGAQVFLMHDGDPIAVLGWVWADGAPAGRIRAYLAANPIPLSRRQTAD